MPNFLSLIPQRSRDLLAGPVSAFESESQSVIQETSPYSEHAILHGVAAMLVLALVLMSVVKLDRVVTAPGRIVPTQGSIFVQPLDRSIIRAIKVSVGDVVKKGQVLATLDPTFAAADLMQLKQKMQSTAALVARLEAEQADQPYQPGADANSSEQLQASIWRQRRSEYQHSLDDFDARIQSDQAKIAQEQADVANYEKRQTLNIAIEQMDTTLESHGYGSKLKSAVSADTRVEIDRLLAEARNGLAQSRHDVDSLKAQREVFVVHWQDDVGTQLVTARNDLDEARQGLAKAEKTSQLTTLESPEDAVVLQIGRASVGSVVDATVGDQTQPLFTLVPLNGPLEADVEIDSKDIGYVRIGDPVEIKLDAYSFMRHGTAQGVIKAISEGSFTQGDNQEIRSPFFRARIEITNVHLRDVPPSFRLIPGMTMGADMHIGRRTIMSYLIDGALKTGSEAMREP
jgi:HlyD family type I secretion membrane fusion protein